MSPSVSVIIPTFNEVDNLKYILPNIPNDYEIIVVDGNSTDGTLLEAQRLRPSAILLTQDGVGKGNALVNGFVRASNEIIIMLDADGSANILEAPRFIQTLLEGTDFAKGTRYKYGGGSEDFSLYRKLGNKFLTLIYNKVYKTNYSDLCYGYNVFWKHCLDFMDLDSLDSGFEIETLINIRMSQSPLIVTEVGSFENSRVHGVSKLHPLRDGFKILSVILNNRKIYDPVYLDNMLVSSFS